MYRFRHLLLPPGRKIPRRQDIGAEGDADEQICEDIDQRGRRSHRCKRLASAESSDHNDIHSVEHQLQDTGEHQRERKGDQFVHDRSITHIYLIFTFFQCYPSTHFLHCISYSVLLCSSRDDMICRQKNISSARAIRSEKYRPAGNPPAGRLFSLDIIITACFSFC